MQLEEYFNLTPDELRNYQNERHEKDYVLVDVRLHEEYEDEHIAGARLIPLAELIDRLTELPADCDILFYCNSGRRSRAAALFATSVPFFQKKVYNLLGGILAYHDHTLSDYPALHAIDLDSSTEKLLLSAMNLERGTALFYEALLLKTKSAVISKTLEKLSKAENSHAHLLYNLWRKNKDNPLSFDDVYNSLSGEVVEGGKNVNELITHIERIKSSSPQAVLEMILDIEYAAYDLYNAIAEKLRGSGMEDSFFSLAQAEKHHMELAARAFAQ